MTSPSTYTISQLAALPQTTASVTVGGRQFTDTGVLLETLVTDAGPAYPASLLNTKNEQLKVTVTVYGSARRHVTFAVGELDPSFGNHPALLALTQNGQPVARGPELVVPGDRAPIRFVPQVSQVTIGIATAPATDTDPGAGSPVEVIDGHHEVTLTAALLARLPAETLHVSFAGPSGVQTHTEVGPSLLEVLAIAGVVPTLNTWVAAVGDDNYVATVTPAEQFAGQRPLRLRCGGHLRRDRPGHLILSGRVCPDEVGDHRAQALARVLLQEVTRAGEHRMVDARGPGHGPLQHRRH